MECCNTGRQIRSAKMQKRNTAVSKKTTHKKTHKNSGKHQFDLDPFRQIHEECRDDTFGDGQRWQSESVSVCFSSWRRVLFWVFERKSKRERCYLRYESKLTSICHFLFIFSFLWSAPPVSQNQCLLQLPIGVLCVQRWHWLDQGSFCYYRTDEQQTPSLSIFKNSS